MASERPPCVFVPAKSLPTFDSQKPIGGLEICRAMQEVCREGKVSVQ